MDDPEVTMPTATVSPTAARRSLSPSLPLFLSLPLPLLLTLALLTVAAAGVKPPEPPP